VPRPPKRHAPQRAKTNERGYTWKWRKAREAYLRQHPLCVMCERDDHQLTPASVVDHVVPHKGDMVLFWDPNNWQALCKTHHDRKTATGDGGFGRVPAPPGAHAHGHLTP
jgi:5-methylcytosine-specific restriction protein A